MVLQLIGTDGLRDKSPEYNAASNQYVSQAAANNEQLLQAAAQSFSLTNQSIGNNIEAIAQSSKAQAEQTAYKGGQFAGVLSGLVKSVVDKQQQQVDSKFKEQQLVDAGQSKLRKDLTKWKSDDVNARGEVEYSDTYSKLRELNNKWESEDLFRKQSPLQFRDAGVEIIKSSLLLNSKQKQDLLNLHYDATDKALTTQYSAQQEYGKKQAQEYRDFVSAQKASTVNNILGGLSAYSDPSAQLQLVNTEIQNVLDDKEGGLTLADRLYIATTMLRTASSKIDPRNEAYAQIQDTIKRYNEYSAEAVPLLSNPTPQNQALNQLLQAKYGVKYDANYFDPLEQQNRAQKLLESQRKISDLRRSNFIDSARSQVLSNNAVGVLALQIYQNPQLADWYKRNPEYGERAGVSTAIAIAESLPKINEQKNTLLQRKASLAVDKARLNQQGILFFINDRVRGQQLLDSYKLGSGVVIPQSEVGLTAQEKQIYQQLINDIQLGIDAEIGNVDRSIIDLTSTLEPLGLNKPINQLIKELPSRQRAYDAEMDAYNKLTSSYNTQQNTKALGVVNPTNGRGDGINYDYVIRSPNGSLMLDPSKTPALYTVKVPTSNSISGSPSRQFVTLPVPATAKGVSIGVNRDYGERRGNRGHAGEDLSVPVGTDVVAYVGGTIVQARNQPEGYGVYVTLKGDDGLYHRFAHLSAQTTVVGQRVQAGARIGVSGNTGRSSGAHIHWEVRKSDGFGTDGTIDPIEYMSGKSVVNSVAKQPTGNTEGWGYNTVDTPQFRVPVGATRLPFGKYLLNGFVGNISNPTEQVQPASEVYKSTNPVKKGYVENEPIPVGFKNNVNDTHGYGYLASNPKFMNKLNDISNKLGINGQWLADVIAFETGNFTKVNSVNSSGYGGLIGFGNADAESFKTTRDAIIRMQPEQQLDYVYKYLNDPQLRPHLSKGVEYVAAAVFGKYGLMKKLLTDRARAMKTDDKAITLNGYLRKLGRDVGRRYNIRSSVSRFDSLLATIHEQPDDNCLMCQQLTASESFVPHESQYTT